MQCVIISRLAAGQKSVDAPNGLPVKTVWLSMLLMLALWLHCLVSRYQNVVSPKVYVPSSRSGKRDAPCLMLHEV